MRASLRIVVAFLVAASWGSAFAEDLTLVWKTSGKTGPEGTRTQYISAHRMRNAEEGKDFIADIAAGRITLIDHRKKEYSEATVAEIEAAMQQAAARMQEMTDKMPPALREKLALGVAPNLPVLVTKGATRKIAGYDAQQYTLSVGDSLKTEMWNTKELPLPVVDAGEFRKLAALGLVQMQGMDKLVEEMKKVEGVSLAQSTSFKMMGHTSQTESEVTEVRKGPIPASTFDVAALAPGYKKVESPLTRMGAPGQRK